MNFPRGSIFTLNRHEFSRKVYMFFGTQIFQEVYSKRHVFSRRFYLFVEQTLLSHRTDTNFPQKPLFCPGTHYEFSRSIYFLIEQILIFQEAISSPRTPTIFQETLIVLEHIQFSRRPLCLEHIGIFQEGTPSRTDISLIGLWLLSEKAFYLLV